MNTATVSIVMPVYNVEKYIEQSIASVLAQTYTNFELILVNDCSQDKSGEICDTFAKKDSRIKIVCKEKNEGLSAARNSGLDIASGDYVLFLDSDDWIEKDLLQSALMHSGKAEITVFGINRVFENENNETIRTEKLTPQTSVLSPEKAFVELTNKKIFNFAWNKLYRRDFLVSCNAQFENVKLIEDFVFNIYIFGYAKSVSIIGKNLYNYRRPAHETLVNTYSPDFFELSKRKYLSERRFLENLNASNETNLQLIYQSFIKHIFSVFIRNNSSKANLTKSEQKDLIYKAISDPVAEDVINSYSPTNTVFSFLCCILRKKDISLLYFLAKLFNKFQSSSAKYFLKGITK